MKNSVERGIETIGKLQAMNYDKKKRIAELEQQLEREKEKLDYPADCKCERLRDALHNALEHMGMLGDGHVAVKILEKALKGEE